VVAAVAAALAATAGSAGAAVIPVKPPGTSVSVKYVAVDPNHAGTVYAATYDLMHGSYPYPGATVYKSTDAGATWVEIGQSLLHQASFAGIAVDSESTVYVNSTGDGVHRSGDGGASWSPSLGVVGTNIIADPSHPGRIYALWNNGIHQSNDGGIIYSDISTGLPIRRPEDPQGPGICTLAIDPTDSAVLYVGLFEKGIYKSTNAGSSWSALDMGVFPSGVVSIAIDPNTSNIVFAGTAEDGLLKSADGGAHWAKVDTGQPNPQFFALAIDRDSAIYAGVYDCCVLVSTDGGASWNDASAELHHAFVMALVPDPSRPGTIYVGSLQ
jgi:hypothetical protein